MILRLLTVYRKKSTNTITLVCIQFYTSVLVKKSQMVRNDDGKQ